MTLREAEKAVLEAAQQWEFSRHQSSGPELASRLANAVEDYRRIKTAGKPKARCYCGKTVSIEGDHLRYHLQPDGDGHWPMLHGLAERGGKLL